MEGDRKQKMIDSFLGKRIWEEKRMSKRKRLRVLTVVLSIILILSSMLPSIQFVQAKKGTNDVKEILNNLTDEQRNALRELKSEKGFTIQPDINLSSTDPVDVIVEFKQEPAKVEMVKSKVAKKRSAISLDEANKKVEASHKQFKEALKGLKKTKSTNKSDELSITREYRNAFNGVAMTLPGNAVENLVRTGIVKRIWKDNKVQLNLPENEKKAEPKMADSIPQIAVDKLHDEGINGEGIEVGVIDTGIDYHHPDLINAYAGYKAIKGEDPSEIDPDTVKGWDFVGNDADPMETTYKDWQASGQPEFDFRGASFYTSHGTHVSGTVAGQKENDVDYAVKGVAPGVDLYTYKVLGPYGSGQTAWVLAGIDKAVKDGMDVINLSLGMGCK